MADDYADDASTSGFLPVNGSVTGHIDSETDADWFRLDLKAGAAYAFTATAADGSEPGIYVYGRGGIPYIMYTNAPGYLNTNVLTTPYSWVDDDQFYLYVKNAHAVDYTVGVRRLADDYLNDIRAAIPLAVGTSVGAQIDYRGDEEYFRVAAVKGSTYKIRLTADGGVLPTDAALKITGSYGWADISYSTENGAAVMTLKAAETQDYYVMVDTAPDVAVAAPVKYHVAMTGNVVTLPPDDYADSFTAAQQLAPGGMAHARLDYAGDEEYFRFAATAGTTYTIRLAADSGVLPSDVKLWRASVESNPQADAYLDGTTMVLQVKAWSSGTIYIGVEAREGSPLAAPLPYHVTMTTASATTPPPATDATPPTLRTVSGTVDGDLTLTFSEALKTDEGRIEFYDAGGNISSAVWLFQPSVTAQGGAVTYHPLHNMLAGTYTLKLVGITDLAGNALNASTSLVLDSTADGGHAVSRPGPLVGSGDNDSAVLQGWLEDYTIARVADDVYDIGGWGATTRAEGIERVMFTMSDDVVALSQKGQLGQAWRLYQAAFDRAPDKGGLGYWLSQQQKGLSLDDVAQNFLQSKEFVERYGVQSNAEFVSTLYHNVLHREGDAGGFAFHVGTLDAGASRANVLSTFSESPENQAQVASLIGNGIVYTPYG
ncbi:DUF4214 domain-containing protein [Pseudoduganella plicata]|nr:DUF4214 domain-containing protein [Pseudoduganella plicata]GGZ06242.1 hypothetical protein GCM10007388_44710 [Pseudoduganella plicata]